jgi:hypothetical protein
MAVSSLSWSISFTVGPYFAGLILESANPSMLWAFCGLVGMLATTGFLVLNKARSADEALPEPSAAD